MSGRQQGARRTSDDPGAATATRSEDAVTTSTRARTKRYIKRIAAVGAVALALSGMAAAPADAMTRSQAVARTNATVGACFASGGDPFVFEFNGSFNVGCGFD